MWMKSFLLCEPMLLENCPHCPVEILSNKAKSHWVNLGRNNSPEINIYTVYTRGSTDYQAAGDIGFFWIINIGRKITDVINFTSRGFTPTPFFRADGRLSCNNHQCGLAATRLLLHTPVTPGGPSDQQTRPSAGQRPEQSKTGFVRVSDLVTLVML